MKKLLLIFFLSIFAGITTTANAQNLDDVVYLKNGSVIKGIIIEQIPNEIIKVATRDGSVFVYKYDEILKFTKEASQKSNFSDESSDKEQRAKTASTKGRYYGNINFGSSFAIYYDAWWLDLQIINGYQFNPYIAVGLGIGVKYSGGVSIPVFAHAKFNFTNTRIVPYMAINLGYNIAASSYFEGVMLEPSIGVGFGVSPKTKLNVAMSYSLNNAIAYHPNSGIAYKYELVGALKFSFGVTF